MRPICSVFSLGVGLAAHPREPFEYLELQGVSALPGMEEHMKKKLVLAVFAAAVSAFSAQAADVFSVPLNDGQTWSFLQSGSIQESDGSSSTWGPVRLDVQIQAVDIQLLDHHADWRILNGDTRFTGTYLAQTAAGLFRVSEGNPATDAVYRYYTDPQPWLYLTQALEVGQVINFTGLRRGQWAVPGAGIEAWSGSWSETYTHLGTETVTTPLGTFNALKLQARSVTTVDARTLFPSATDHATWDELRWFVPGFGYVKVQGSGIYETDYNGDGIVDRWQREAQTMVAVPEPATVWSLLAGLTLLVAVRRRRSVPAHP
jgi:hypothetical protein